MFSLAWRWSSFTHALALSSDAYRIMSADGSPRLVNSYLLQPA
jgi:hypothetical protein